MANFHLVLDNFLQEPGNVIAILGTANNWHVSLVSTDKQILKASFEVQDQDTRLVVKPISHQPTNASIQDLKEFILFNFGQSFETHSIESISILLAHMMALKIAYKYSEAELRRLLDLNGSQIKISKKNGMVF